MTDTPNEFEQFRKTFFEECAEILADLEGRLEQLQEGASGTEDLNAIFRAVHSIKAGAGAFNYMELVRFTHVFENLLDHMRDGRIVPDERVTNTLIRAGDVLSALVAAAQEGETVAPDFGGDVAEELQAILDRSDGGTGKKAKPPIADDADTEQAEPTTAGDGEDTKKYRIGFRPHAELFRHANEPLLIIRELKQLGELSATCDPSRLPSLQAMEPEEAYLAWTFELTSACSRDAVLEAFEFVDQDCDLSIEIASADSANANAGASTPAEIPDTGAGKTAQPGTGAVPAPAAEAPAPAADNAGRNQRSSVSSIRVDISRIDRLVNMAGELVIAQAMLAQRIDDQCLETGQPAVQGHEELATLTRELQECVMAIRMQPVKSVFARMPRLVREIASKLGKSVKLVTSGEQTEVDKTVIEELADPLTHIIRNAVDHGIEQAEKRRANGKAEEGRIELSASHVGSNIPDPDHRRRCGHQSRAPA